MSTISRFATGEWSGAAKWILSRVTVYRFITAIGLIAAVALALSVPARMMDPDDWAYYYGVHNFAHGQLTVSDQVHSQQVSEAQQKGGQLIQYVSIGDNTWALEKAPGYVFYLVPFELLGIPRWGNILLAIGMVIVTYLLLKRMRDEKTAMIGSLLMLLTPISLVMLNRSYIDTYSSLSFLAMGGGLYIYYHLERNNLSRRAGIILLFISFLLVSWSVVCRYTNFPVAALLGLHFIISRLKRKPEIRKWEVAPVVVGIAIPTAVLLLYDYLVFGSPLHYGYQYSHFPIKFAIQYLGQVNQNGQSVPLQLISNNLKNAPRAFLLGFPLLLFGIPGIITVLYFKFAAFFRKGKTNGVWSSLNKEVPWDILLVMVGWFIFVFFLYLTYEWTAEFQGSSSFITFDRFYVPGLFPIAVISALIISRFPFKMYIPATLIVVGFGAALYAQSVMNVHILPEWFGNGLPGRPGGGSGGLPGGGVPGRSNNGFPVGPGGGFQGGPGSGIPGGSGSPPPGVGQ